MAVPTAITEERVLGPASALMATKPVDLAGKRLAVDVVAGELRKMGLAPEQADVDDLPMVSAELGRAGAPAVVIHAHLDVVEPDWPGHHMPIINGDDVKGRGIADTLGHAAAQLAAVRGLRPENARFILLFTTDEEDASRDQFARWWENHLHEVAFVVTLEPPGGLGLVAKGRTIVDVSVAGRPAHVGYYEQGIDANALAQAIGAEIYWRAPWLGSGGLFPGGTSIGVPSVHGQAASFNSLAVRSRNKLQLRVPPDVPLDEVERAIQDSVDHVVARYARQMAGLHGRDEEAARREADEALTVGVAHDIRAVQVSADHPFVRALERAHPTLRPAPRRGASSLGKTLHAVPPVGCEIGAIGTYGHHGDEGASKSGLVAFANGMREFMRIVDSDPALYAHPVTAEQ